MRRDSSWNVNNISPTYPAKSRMHVHSRTPFSSSRTLNHIALMMHSSTAQHRDMQARMNIHETTPKPEKPTKCHQVSPISLMTPIELITTDLSPSDTHSFHLLCRNRTTKISSFLVEIPSWCLAQVSPQTHLRNRKPSHATGT